MTLAEPIPEKSIVMVGDEQGTIVRILRWTPEFGQPTEVS